MGLMGVDIGSSSCKATIFDAAGHMLAAASREYEPSFPGPGRAEMDPARLWEAVSSAIAAAARDAAEPVAALAISSHGETFVPVDAHGAALAPAILNVDNRATVEAGECEAEFGERRLFATTGQIVNATYPLNKLAWLRRYQPDVFRTAHRFVGPGEYALLRMGLPPHTDGSLASRWLAFGVKARRWSEELLDFAGLTEARLPVVAPAGSIVGRLEAEAAGTLGLPAGTLVAVGGHDQACGALGMGAIAPGLVADSMGTYECVTRVDDAPRLDETARAGKLNSYCHVVPACYITIVYFPAGIMMKWYADLLGEGEGGYADLEAHAPAGPTGLLVLPHLIGSSTPHFDPRATGAIVGLTPGSDRARLYKGILEGMACELGVVTEVLTAAAGPVETIRATGGGARSRLGLQLRADLTGVRFQVMENPESVGLGAALLAGVAAGVYADLEEAVARTVRVVDTVEPSPDGAKAYAGQVRRYRALYPALAAIREESA
jgi:xylulokinase